MAVTYFNGFFYLKGFPEDRIPAWVTTDYGDDKPYFHLNYSSREKFKRDILPLIKSGEVVVGDEVLQRLRDYNRPRFAQFGVELGTYKTVPGFTLYDYQDTAVRIMLKNKKFGFFLGTGTGKTLIAITWLLNNPILSGVLVVTPKKMISQYQKQCDLHLPNHTKKQITVTNFEQLHNHRTKNYQAVIIDESHRAKSYTSDTNENLRRITSKAANVYLFTGTPQDDSRHEIIPQLALLNERYMPGKTRFLHRYFNLDEYYNPKSEKRHVSDELTSMIHEITWGRETDQVLDLPEEKIIKVMCDKPEKYYEPLLKNSLVEVGPYTVVADSKSSLKIKLREICSGHVNALDDDDNLHTVMLSTPKIPMFYQLIKKVNTAIIYTEFDADILKVTHVLNMLNRSHVVVNGKTANSGPLIEKFSSGQVDFLVIQSRSGNAGLDLYNTNNVIFYSMPESYIVYHQCKSRIRRIGQSKTCNYYHMICKETVEEQIFKSLKKKKSFSTRLFKTYN